MTKNELVEEVKNELVGTKVTIQQQGEDWILDLDPIYLRVVEILTEKVKQQCIDTACQALDDPFLREYGRDVVYTTNVTNAIKELFN